MNFPTGCVQAFTRTLVVLSACSIITVFPSGCSVRSDIPGFQSQVSEAAKSASWPDLAYRESFAAPPTAKAPRPTDTSSSDPFLQAEVANLRRKAALLSDPNLSAEERRKLLLAIP